MAQGFAHTIHARILGFETPTGKVGCEACHGDAAEHLESGEATSLTRFGEDSETDTAACLACHARHTIKEWDVSAHADELSCTDCHSIHTDKGPENKCADCHYDVQAAMRAPSHHPVPEGKMSCASCHNVHAANESALKTDERTNDLCLECHSAKQGPFVFEHDPVMEDCLLCHSPHGSVADNLLTANEPFLCLQCHEFHFHAGLEANEEDGEQMVGGKPYNNVMGEHGYQQAFSTKCTQCHTQIHGSDLPSQGVTSRGQSMTR